jgi:hypothetical protein
MVSIHSEEERHIVIEHLAVIHGGNRFLSALFRPHLLFKSKQERIVALIAYFSSGWSNEELEKLIG